jgi:predicted dehydrogenase
MSAELVFPGGVPAHLECSMTVAAPRARLGVTGARGSLEIVNFIAPQLGCRFITEIDGETRTHRTDGPTTYAAQLAHVGEVLAGKVKALTGGADAIANMALIEAIYAAARRPQPSDR